MLHRVLFSTACNYGLCGSERILASHLRMRLFEVHGKVFGQRSSLLTFASSMAVLASLLKLFHDGPRQRELSSRWVAL